MTEAVPAESLMACHERPNCLTGHRPPFNIEIVLNRRISRPGGRTLAFPAAERATAKESSLYILIALLVLFIAAIVAAYFGARTWHWAHVTLVVFVFLATVGFLFMAAETLRINAIQRAEVNRLQQQVEEVEARNEALEHGTDDGQVIGRLIAQETLIAENAESVPSISDLDHELHLVTRRRGRVWNGVAPAGFNPQTGAVQATIEAPQPSGLVPNTVVYLFEAGPPAQPDATQGKQFLGEFRVTNVAGPQVTLDTTHQLDEFEARRLAASQGPWVLYEQMPTDQHDLFAGLTEEQLRKWLPEASIQEYLRQGSEAGPDDDEWERAWLDEEGNPLGPDDSSKAAKTVYDRRLRDYALEFDQLARQRVVLLADIAGVMKDNERLKLAQESAKQLEAFRQDEINKLNTDLTGVKKERQIIENHLATIETQLANARKLLDEALAHNEQLARRLAALQAQAAQRDRSSAAPNDGPLALAP